MRLLLTRPAAEAMDLAARLGGLGHAVMIEPVLRIVPVEPPVIQAEGVQAVLLTSRHGAQALGGRHELRMLPVLAVGGATERAAREAGCRDVRSAAGDAASLARLVRDSLDPQAGRLLHLAGREVAVDLAGELGAAGFAVERVVAYAAEATPALSAGAQVALHQGALDAVLFFSPRSATVFVDLAGKARVLPTLRRLLACCISAATAATAGAVPWGRIAVADEPTETAMIRLCDEH